MKFAASDLLDAINLLAVILRYVATAVAEIIGCYMILEFAERHTRWWCPPTVCRLIVGT